MVKNLLRCVKMLITDQNAEERCLYVTLLCVVLFSLYSGHLHAGTVSYTHDPLGRITRAEILDSGVMISYSYDAVGNRLSMTYQGPSLPPLEASDTGFFSLDNTTLQLNTTTYDEKWGDLTYEVAIGTSSGGSDVLDWSQAEPGPSGTIIVDGLNLPLNQEYFISTRVRNFAGDIVSNQATTDGIIVLDPAEDPDEDGFDNQTEVAVMSNPLDPNSFPGDTSITLYPGMNLVAVPAEVEYMAHLSSWIDRFGDATEIEQILYLDRDVGKFIVLKPGQSPSEDIILQGGEALVVYSKVEKTITFNTVLCAEPELVPGFNLVGFSCPPENYTAYDLLQDYGSDVVTSIRRFSPQKGTYETAGFDDNGTLLGINFPIIRGEGYILFVKH